MLLGLTHRHLLSLGTSRVNYKKIEQLEIELGIIERPLVTGHSHPQTSQNVDIVVKDCYFSNPVLYKNRCIVSSVPINPTTGEELHIQPQLQFVNEDDPYPEIT